MNKRRFKRSALLACGLLLVLVVVPGLWVWKAKRQYALNRQLIVALAHYDNKQALLLVNAGADPNTRYNASPAPSLPQLVRQLLHRSPPLVDDSSTAFLFVCGVHWHFSDRFIIVREKKPEDGLLVRTMLAHDADRNARDSQDVSALHWAIWRDYSETVQLLLEYGANVNAQDREGKTPLMLAVEVRDTGMTRLLLEHGANISMADKWGDTALHFAVSSDYGEDRLHLLMAHGGDPNYRNKKGVTPIMLAQQAGRPDLVALLRGNGRFYPHPAYIQQRTMSAYLHSSW